MRPGVSSTAWTPRLRYLAEVLAVEQQEAVGQQEHRNRGGESGQEARQEDDPQGCWCGHGGRYLITHHQACLVTKLSSALGKRGHQYVPPVNSDDNSEA